MILSATNSGSPHHDRTPILTANVKDFEGFEFERG